jgi:chaperonin GroEL
MQYAKVKSVSKEILGRGPALRDLILKTMKACSDVVGSTLGPGGMSVVIERQEERLPPMITKDGVTVFRNLGFNDPAMQVLMESARDAAIRTAAEAGDGTTTATILAEALVRKTMEFCDKNPKVSPQRVVRTLEKGFKVVVEPWIRDHVLTADLASKGGRERLRAVAKVSANGDTQLADAVLKCFDLCGDEGNVTLIEASGPSGYEVEHMEGFPIGAGYEESCGKFYQAFINDPGRQLCALNNPRYILYHGRLADIYSALTLFEKIGEASAQGVGSHNIVIVATGFSETVLAHLATNFQDPRTPNIYPLVAPMSPMQTGQYDFLADLAGITGGTIFDPLNAPLENAELAQLGTSDSFEAARFRSTVLGFRDEILILERVDQLKQLLKSGSLSIQGTSIVQERLGKITGGISKLKIVGASAGELREKRDRAEDAICAVRGALKNGALPGGGWTLLKLRAHLDSLDLLRGDEFTKVEHEIFREVLGSSLTVPVERLFGNAGYTQEEVEVVVAQILAPAPMEVPIGQEDLLVFDVLEGKMVDALQGGILDSTPAVLEAVRNSISIASLLGTCGGIVAFLRDNQLERQDARDTNEFLRNLNTNEADERG